MDDECNENNKCDKLWDKMTRWDKHNNILALSAQTFRHQKA